MKILAWLWLSAGSSERSTTKFNIMDDSDNHLVWLKDCLGVLISEELWDSQKEGNIGKTNIHFILALFLGSTN